MTTALRFVRLPFMKILLFALAVFVSCLRADTVKDREGAVRGDKAAMEKDARWIYNDWERGFELGKKLNKPVLIVLRCVPCLACAGIDASVLNEPALEPLLDQFVRVRLINANAIDLARFQFDYDLSFSALMFNPDGTVYGRYGSWKHQKDPLDKTTSSLKEALEGALTIHRGYPANKTSLAAKQGLPLPFKSPLEIPQLAVKYHRELDWEGKVVQSCVHCHMVGEAVRSHYRTQEKTIPTQWIYPWPAPETIGLTLAPDHRATVEAVTPDSPAAQAGFKAGDEITSLDNAPMLSAADVSWILHRSPDVGVVQGSIKRSGKEQQISLKLPQDWRARSDISKRVGTWSMRAMATGGLLLEDLSDEDRAKQNIAKDKMALFIKHAGEYGEHAAAKKAGFRKDDIIVELEGSDRRTTESDVIGKMIRNHKPGEKVAATVLRGSERVNLMLPVQ